MKERQRTVYYCDFCRKHGMRRNAIEQHEPVCTLNPNRTCRWQVPDHPPLNDDDGPLIVHLIAEIQKRARSDDGGTVHLVEADIAWLRDQLAECPACILAVLRQSGIDYGYDARAQRIFDYTEQVERARAAEREAWRDQEHRDIEATFL